MSGNVFLCLHPKAQMIKKKNRSRLQVHGFHLTAIKCQMQYPPPYRFLAFTDIYSPRGDYVAQVQPADWKLLWLLSCFSTLSNSLHQAFALTIV